MRGHWSLRFNDLSQGETTPSADSSLLSSTSTDHVFHYGDLVLITQSQAHVLQAVNHTTAEANSAQPHTDSAESACLRLIIRLASTEMANYFHALPPLVTVRNVSYLQNITLEMSEALAFDSEAEEGGLVRTLASLLLGVILGHSSKLRSVQQSPRLDPEIAQTLLVMEREPSKPWTIERLAGEVGISRSALAQKFKEQVGSTLSEHLLNIRMQIAHELLLDHRHHLKEIARRIGYQSVSAFSTAFKRWSGQSPSTYRKSTLS